ncbi:MAG TPA: hypothetical protein VGF59_07940 [Bryobacteraceae bacterium]
MQPLSRLWTIPILAVAGMITAYLIAIQVVRASSEEAWDALVKEASAACQMASELENPRVVWSNPAYDRQAALIITGKWPQTHMKGAQGYMLCLFDKQSAKVEIQEIEPALFK